MKVRNPNNKKRRHLVYILMTSIDLLKTSNDLKLATPWVYSPGHYGHLVVKKWESDQIKLNGTAIKKKLFCGFPIEVAKLKTKPFKANPDPLKQGGGGLPDIVYFNWAFFF